MNGSPFIEQSDTGNYRLPVGFTRDISDEGEDDCAIRVYAVAWPPDTFEYTQTYQILISTWVRTGASRPRSRGGRSPRGTPRRSPC